MTDTASGGRPGKGLRRAGIILMVLAVVLGAAAVIAGFAPLFGDRPVEVGERTTLTAEEGDELALYRIGGLGGEGSCRVTGPDGGDVELRRVAGSETLTLDGVSYGVDRVFTATDDGEHVVSCAGRGYAVGPRIGVFGIVGLVLAGIFGGIAMFVLGVVLLIAGVVRGRSSDRTPPGQPPYPGQPYPGQPYPGQPPYPGGQQWGAPGQPTWGQPGQWQQPGQGPPPPSGQPPFPS